MTYRQGETDQQKERYRRIIAVGAAACLLRGAAGWVAPDLDRRLELQKATTPE
jgi:hypothetical protein